MIAMYVIGLGIDENNQSPVVVLSDEAGQMLLSVWLGALEAIAISLTISGGQLPRPLTHDLMLNMLQSCGASLTSVSITHMQQGSYHAKLSLQLGTHSMDIDCRPSDAITLALRTGAPILVSTALLRQVSTTDSAEIADQKALLQSPTEIAAYVQHQSSLRLRQSLVKKSPSTSPPSPHSAEEDDDEQAKRCAALLRSLEPESRRKM